MFRFGVPSDVISDLINIKDKILMKVYRNLVEFIVMEGVDEYNLAMAMWLVSHCQGHLFVNSPVPNDLKKLVHIANVTEKSKVRDLVASVARHLVKYPTHFVLETTFDTANSLFDAQPPQHQPHLRRGEERLPGQGDLIKIPHIIKCLTDSTNTYSAATSWCTPPRTTKRFFCGWGTR